MGRQSSLYGRLNAFLRMKDYEFLKEQAENFANVCIIERDTIASVHLEDERDREFWEKRLNEVKSGHYNYIYQSRVGSKTESCASGSIQCLRYVGYFSKHFFACVDSDLHFLHDDIEYCSQNFLVQTYTYSWENHICELNHLQNRYDNSYYKKNNLSFDFITFLSQFSEILYKPLLYLIYYTKTNSKKWNVKLFNACIPAQFSTKDLYDHGENFLKTVSTNLENAVVQLSLSESEFEKIKHRMLSKGLTPSNAYLYIQGHKIYGLVKMIGSLLMEKIGPNFQQECLAASSPISGYPEVERIRDDIKSIIG